MKDEKIHHQQTFQTKNVKIISSGIKQTIWVRHVDLHEKGRAPEK